MIRGEETAERVIPRWKPGHDRAAVALPRPVSDPARIEPDARLALEREREFHLDGDLRRK